MAARGTPAKAVVIGTNALDQRALDLGIGPASDPGFGIGRDIRGGDDKGGVVNVSPPDSALSSMISPLASRGEWQLPHARMVLTR